MRPLIFIIVQDKGHMTTFATVLCSPHLIHPVYDQWYYSVKEVGTKQYSSLGKKKATMTSSQVTTIKMAFTQINQRLGIVSLMRERGRWSRNNQSYDVITT